MTFADRVEKQNLYQRASFAAELEMPLEDVQRLRNSLEAPMEDGKPMVTNIDTIVEDRVAEQRTW